MLENVPLTLRHYYRPPIPLKTVETAEDWDALRTTRAFNGNTDADPGIAHAAIAALRHLNAQSVCSYGVGAGQLERAITTLAPDIELTATDYAPETVRRLQQTLPGANVIRHDIRQGPLPADAHLMYRIDTELSDFEWRRLLVYFREPIVMMPGGLLTLRLLASSVRARQTGGVRAGYIRTEAALRKLWSETHVDQSLEGRRGFLLTHR